MRHPRKKRLSPPLMLAFRSTAGRRKGDATRPAGPRSGPTEGPAERRYAVKVAATEQLVRAEVLDDLSMLVNTVALESTVDLTDFPHVRASVLNFGVPDIGARTIEGDAVEAIGTELASALQMFEPRLLADTIAVGRDATVDAAGLALRYVVRADLVCNPVNVPVEFVADVEVHSRKIVIERL